MKKVFLGLIILVLVASVSSIAVARDEGADESEKYLKWWDSTYKGTDSAIIGGIMFQKGDYKTAIGELEESIKAGSQDGRIYYQLAFAYQQTGNIDRGIELYKKAAELLDEQDPKHRYDYYARYNLAFLYKDKGDTDSSIATIKEALSKHKEPGGYNLLSWLYWKQGKTDEALKECRTSVKINPNQEDAQYNLGVLYYNKGEVKHARKAFEKVIELNPDHSKAIVYLGNLGDETVLEKIEYKDLLIPEPALGHCYKGKLYLDKGKIIDAKQEYETAFEINPESPIVNQGLGVIYEYNEEGLRYGKGFNIKKSIFHYKKALKADPKLVEAAFNLAVLDSMEGKTDDAIKLYTRVLRSQPDNIEAHYNLAILYDNEKDNYKKARYHYTKFLTLDPRTPKQGEIRKRLIRLTK